MLIAADPTVIVRSGDMSAQDIEAMREASHMVSEIFPVIGVTVAGIILVAVTWLLLHYVTKWRQAKTLTNEDEALLDDLHETARRLDDRLMTIERIVAADRLTTRN